MLYFAAVLAARTPGCSALLAARNSVCCIRSGYWHRRTDNREIVVSSRHFIIKEEREEEEEVLYSDSHHDASSFAFASAAFFASATLCRRVSAITALGFFPASFCSSDCSFRFPMLIGEKGQFNLSAHSLHLYNQHNCKPCSFTLVDHLWTTCGPNYTALPPSTLADTTSCKVKHSDDSFKWQQQQVVMGSQLELPR